MTVALGEFLGNRPGLQPHRDHSQEVGEEPDVGIEIAVGCLVAEIGADEFLEIATFFALGLGGGAVGEITR